MDVVSSWVMGRLISILTGALTTGHVSCETYKSHVATGPNPDGARYLYQFTINSYELWVESIFTL